MEDFILKWWGFIVFVVSGLVGWIIGVERNRWKINDLTKEMMEQKQEIKEIKSSIKDDAVSFAKLFIMVERVELKLDNIERRLDQKVDKD